MIHIAGTVVKMPGFSMQRCALCGLALIDTRNMAWVESDEPCFWGDGATLEITQGNPQRTARLERVTDEFDTFCVTLEEARKPEIVLQVNIVTNDGLEEIYFIGQAKSLFHLTDAYNQVRPPRRNDILSVKVKQIDEKDFRRIKDNPDSWKHPTSHEQIP